MPVFNFIKSIYQESFLQLRDSFPRRKYLSYSLLTFQLLQIQGIFLKAEVIQQTEIKGIMAGIIWLLESSKIYPVFQSSTNLNQIYFAHACFFIALIFSVLVILYTFLKLRISQTKSNGSINGLFQFDTLQKPLNVATTWETRAIDVIMRLISFFLQIYRYILHWTAINSCLRNINWGFSEASEFYSQWINLTGVLASFFVLILFTIIDFLLIFHTFDYKFKNIDYLGEKDQNISILFHLYTYISIFIMVFTQQSYSRLMLFLGLLQTLFGLLLSTLQLIYRTELLNNYMSLLLGQFIFIYTGTLLYCYDQLTIQHINNLVILTSPFVFHLWNQILRYKQCQNIFLDGKNHKNIEEKLRRIYHFIKITYDHDWTVFKKPILRQPITLDLFSIAVNHLRTCKGFQLTDTKYQIMRKCFCREYFPITEEQTQKYWKKEVLADMETKIFAFQNEKQFKSFLHDLIKSHFEAHLSSKSALQTNSYFSYVYFLIQVIKRPTKAFYEAMNLKLLLRKSMSLKKSMIIEQLIKDAKQNFDLMIEKKDLKNQKYNFQQAFEFDRNMELAKLNFQIILTNYKKWYYQLLSEKLSLEQILKKGAIINQQITYFDNQLQDIYSLNPLSTEVDTIFYLFYRYLNFNIKRPKSTKRDSKFANEFIQSIHSKVFQRDSCLVYLSLMNQRGIIKNYTKNFKQIVGANDQGIKDQNIKLFMPDSISIHHDLYLDNFIELGRMNIVMAEQRFLLVKCTTQFIVPVNAKVRLENYQTDDFGSSALITKINQSYYYAVVSKLGILEEISQNFYEEIIQKAFDTPINQIKNLNLTRLMPCLLKDLQILEQRQVDNEIDFEFSGEKAGQINYDLLQEGHIIIPKYVSQISTIFQEQKMKQSLNLHEYLLAQQKYNQQYFQNIHSVHGFFIRYKIRLMKTINSVINILEIQYIKVLKAESLEKALQSVQSLCNLDYATQKKYSVPQINIAQYEQNTIPQFSKVELDFQQVKQPLGKLEEYNLDDNFFIEDIHMISQKERNVGDVSLQKNNQTSMLNSMDSQMFGKQRDHQFLLDTNVSNIEKKQIRKNSLQTIPQRVEQVHSIDPFDNTFNSDSSASKEQPNEKTFQQDGASSIGSSQQYNDYVSKRRVLREVLYSGHQADKNSSKITILILNIMLLTVLYLINFVFFFTISQQVSITQIIQDLQLIEQNKHVPSEIMNAFNSYIISSSAQKWSTYDQQWYESLQNYSAESYLNYTESIFNEQNAIIYQSSFDEQQSIYVSDESEISVNQLFFYRLIGQYMFDSSNSNRFFILNYEIFVNNMLLKLNESVIDNVEFAIKEIESQQIYILMFSEITLMVIVAILLPILLMINNKKNTILQFFTTIAAADIQQQHETYTLLTDRLEETKFTSTETNQFEIESLHIKKFAKRLKTMNSKQIKQNQSQSKFRTIIGQSTTPMIITNIILGIVLFSIVSAYFLSSFIMKLDSLQSYKQMNSEQYTFSCLQTEFLRISSIQNLLLQNIVQDNYSLISEKGVLQLLNDQKDQTFAILNYYSFKLSDLLFTVDSQKYEIIASNICGVFSSTFTDSLLNYIQFDYQTCESFGSMQKGIQIVLNDFINQIKEFYSLLLYHQENSENYETIASELPLLENQELQQMYFYTWFALQMMLDSDDVAIQDSLSKSLKSQIILFTFCAIFIVIFSIVVERYIKNLISNYINQSRLLLTLIPFEILQSNAYVMNYVIQESKKLNA